jgi:endonuclease-3
MEKLCKDYIVTKLRLLISEPKSELNFTNNFELLVAVMLSAQCTDKRVNEVTKVLFKKYPTCYDLAKANLQDVEECIKSCNFFHNKAKNIIQASIKIVDKFNGEVPSEHEDLIGLSGVGNKTANVVQAVGFGKQAFAVDTHILRVSNRLGIANTKSPDICENALKKFYEGYDYGEVHHLMLLFGRYHCTARNPKCSGCIFEKICNYKREN